MWCILKSWPSDIYCFLYTAGYNTGLFCWAYLGGYWSRSRGEPPDTYSDMGLTPLDILLGMVWSPKKMACLYEDHICANGRCNRINFYSHSAVLSLHKDVRFGYCGPYGSSLNQRLSTRGFHSDILLLLWLNQTCTLLAWQERLQRLGRILTNFTTNNYDVLCLTLGWRSLYYFRWDYWCTRTGCMVFNNHYTCCNNPSLHKYSISKLYIDWELYRGQQHISRRALLLAYL